MSSWAINSTILSNYIKPNKMSETSKNNETAQLGIGGVSTRELLSDYAHEAWCGWMKYMFSKAEINSDGTWTMPQWAVARWQRQMNTKYNELPEEEKKTDREEADKMLSIFHGC
jgi:hypothetical protein